MLQQELGYLIWKYYFHPGIASYFFPFFSSLASLARYNELANNYIYMAGTINITSMFFSCKH